jgi:hypothetical protein
MLIAMNDNNNNLRKGEKMKAYEKTTTQSLTRAARVQLARDIEPLLRKEYPTERGGKRLTCLSNKHFGADKLFLPELPSTAGIPWRYEAAYPNWKFRFGEQLHEPDPEPLVPDNELLALWADSGIYPSH